MRVLVTGGTGYIGSHTCVSLIAAGHQPVVVDNLCNSSAESLRRVTALGGGEVPFVEADVRNEEAVFRTLKEHAIDAVIHFAGLKSVAESVRERARYLDNNVGGTEAVARAMTRAGLQKLVFSSSASVYGLGGRGCVDEFSATEPANPYAESKLLAEQTLLSFAAKGGMKAALLRYFNPVGAHPGGSMGEDPLGTPNNLMPYICQVAGGRLPRLQIFGNDYPTPDGTGVRDYIHVMDLAEGHVSALAYLDAAAPGDALICNLGSGRGHSVMEVLRSFETVNGLTIPHEVVARRPGDVASYYANPELAAQKLGWRTQRSLTDMCRDAWHWQRSNPHGYR